MKQFDDNRKPRKPKNDPRIIDDEMPASEASEPSNAAPHRPERYGYPPVKPAGAPLSKGMKIYLAVAVPVLVLILIALVYVLFFVKPPSGPSSATSTPTSTTPVTTTPPATTTPITTTTTTTQATTTTTTTASATTTTTAATTTATTQALSEEERVLAALAEIAEEPKISAKPLSYDVDVSGYKQKDGVYTILMVGLDNSNKRTDTIMMLTLDSIEKTVSVMSVPRDLMSTSAFGNLSKINAAYAQGIERTMIEVTNVLGYAANRYIVVNYDGFERLIDALGGIEINVFMDMYYTDTKEGLVIDLKEGLQTLNGEKALHYVRYRSGYAAADIKRIEIQQEFYTAIIEKLARPETVFKIAELADILSDCVKTDLTTGEIIWLGTHFYDMNVGRIKTGKVPTHSVTIDGISYEAAYEGTLRKRVNSGYNPYTEEITTFALTLPDETALISGTTTASGTETGTATTTEAATTATTTAPVTTTAATTTTVSTPPAWLG